MNSTPALEASAREKFEKLHPEHRKPGTQGNYEIKLYPAQFTHHLRVVCECGYLWRYTERELTDKARPRMGCLPQAGRTRMSFPDGPPQFRSSIKQYKGPGRA